ncbi:MAG TPA: TonB-dependent siderophore receptor [Vicinamibacterales bacterium]|nr:TonB-dependent siderophore receptor [Vicinamibacterales bacterium]
MLSRLASSRPVRRLAPLVSVVHPRPDVRAMFVRASLLSVLGMAALATVMTAQPAAAAAPPDIRAVAVQAAAPAQASAAVRGTVVDATGARIAGVRIVATTTDGRSVTSTTTGADGTYTLTGLPPGRYVVIASRAGFDDRRETIDLATGETRALNVTLTVAGVSAQVAVVGEGLTVEHASATKSDVPLIETPASISIVTHETIDAQGATSVPQALRYATAIVPESRGAMTALDYMYSRGFLVNQYQDGLRLLSGGYSIPQLDPYLLDRAELLRGPASVLYGQSDPGGVLNLATKQPTDGTIRQVELQVGSYSRFQANFDAGGQVGDHSSLRYRIAGTAHAADTQVDHTRDKRVSLAPSLRWRPDAATTATVSAAVQHDPSVGFYNWIPAYGTVLPNPADPSLVLPTSFDTGDPSFDLYSRTLASISARVERRLGGGWTIRENLRHAYVRSAFDKIYSSYLDPDGRTLYRYAWHLRDHLNALTFDTQAENNFTSGRIRHTVLVGGDYQRGWYHQGLGYNFDSGSDPGQVPSLDLLNPIYDQRIETPPLDNLTDQVQDQFGLYAQDHMALDRWRVLVGGRHDWAATTTTDVASGDVTDQPDHASTGRAGLVYLAPQGFAPYASVSQSFQPTSGTDFDGQPFKPTTGQQYEGGVKYQVPDRAADVTFAVYQLTQQHVLSPDPIHIGDSIQTGEIRSRGVEMSGQAQLVGGVGVTASYSHAATVVTEAGVAFGPGVGNTPSGVPADLASFWISYALRESRLSGLGLAGGVRSLGSSWGDDDNTFRVPRTTLIDLAISYDFGAPTTSGLPWRAAVNVSNLFDKTYVASCSGTDYCAYGFRRTILATIGRRW